MMALYRLTILLLVVYSVSSFKRVCYYTNWSQSRPAGGRFTPDDINPYLCTHIIFAYARIVGDEIRPTVWNDEDTQHVTGQYEKVTSLKNINPNLKILLGVSGWNTVSLLGSWPNSKQFRTNFIDHTIAYLRQRNFDGIDLNWAGPTARRKRPVNRNIFTDMLQELRNGFEKEANSTGNKPLLLTAAVSAERVAIENRYDVPRLARLLDFLNVMTFDLQGSWGSTLEHHSALYPRASQIGDERYKNADEAMSHWVNLGAPNSKLLLGIPFYGRTFHALSPGKTNFGDPDSDEGPASPYTMENGFISYYEVCNLRNSGATKRWHDEHKVPYLINGTTWVAYDDKQSIAEKTKWTKTNHFGGVVVWALDLDDFMGDFCNEGPYPLMQTIFETLNMKRESSKDDENFNMDMSSNTYAELGQQMSETMQASIIQSEIGQGTTLDLSNNTPGGSTLLNEAVPTKEQLAIINGGLVGYPSTNIGASDVNINGINEVAASTHGNLKIQDTSLFNGVASVESVATSGATEQQTDLMSTNNQEGNALSQIELQNNIALSDKSANALYKTAASTLDFNKRQNQASLPGNGLVVNNLVTGIDGIQQSNLNAETHPNNLNDITSLNNMNVLSGTASNLIQSTDEQHFTLLQNNYASGTLNNANPMVPGSKITQDNAVNSTKNTIFPLLLGIDSKTAESSNIQLAADSNNDGASHHLLGTGSNIVEASNLALGTDSNTVVGDSRPGADSYSTFTDSNRVHAKTENSGSDKVIILPFNQMPGTVNAGDSSTLMQTSESMQSDLGVSLINDQLHESKVDSSVGPAKPEVHVYDISPSIRDAVPKTMTTSERKSYADKVKKESQKTHASNTILANKASSTGVSAEKTDTANQQAAYANQMNKVNERADTSSGIKSALDIGVKANKFSNVNNGKSYFDSHMSNQPSTVGDDQTIGTKEYNTFSNINYEKSSILANYSMGGSITNKNMNQGNQVGEYQTVSANANDKHSNMNKEKSSMDTYMAKKHVIDGTTNTNNVKQVGEYQTFGAKANNKLSNINTEKSTIDARMSNQYSMDWSINNNNMNQWNQVGEYQTASANANDKLSNTYSEKPSMDPHISNQRAIDGTATTKTMNQVGEYQTFGTEANNKLSNINTGKSSVDTHMSNQHSMERKTNTNNINQVGEYATFDAKAKDTISNTYNGKSSMDTHMPNQRSITNARILSKMDRSNLDARTSSNIRGKSGPDLVKHKSTTDVSGSSSNLPNRGGKGEPKRKRQRFSIERNIPKKRKTLDSFLSRNGNSENMMATNEFGVPFSILCKYHWYVLCFDHIDKVYMHGKDWKEVKGVYVKPENITTTTESNQIIIQHSDHV